jgi:chromate transporter
LAHENSGAERLAEDSSATAVLSPDGSVVAAVPAHATKHPTLSKIFLVFLYIGAISFGGGVVAYLRNDLVKATNWLDDESFVELLAISQTLPGLNATNMAVLVGDRLAGRTGPVVALIGICLPGFAMMLATGVLYGFLRHNPLINAILHSVAGAAVGLVLATTLQLSKKSVKTPWDWAIVVLCVIGINGMKQTVPIVLLVVGALAIFPHRPKKTNKDQPA